MDVTPRRANPHAMAARNMLGSSATRRSSAAIAWEFARPGGVAFSLRWTFSGPSLEGRSRLMGWLLSRVTTTTEKPGNGFSARSRPEAGLFTSLVIRQRIRVDST